MIINNPSQLKRILAKLQIASLAKESGFILRRSHKIDPELLVESFFQMISLGRYSLRQWAWHLSILSNQRISFQAIAKKLDFRQEPFFQGLFQRALLMQVQSRLNFDIRGPLQSFKRVLLEDSTCFKLPKSLFQFFPGAQLPFGKLAGGRLQLRLDLKTLTYDGVALQSFRQHDANSATDIMKSIQKDELVIRDLGYWKISVLARIMQIGAFFLSRLRLDSRILSPDTRQALSLYTLLRKAERQGLTQLDIPILLHAEHQVPVRMVAMKLKPDQIMKRRNMAKRQRHKDDHITKQTRYLLSWNVFITNVSPSIWSTQDVYQVYTFRWQIEMIFKCWKSKFNFAGMFKHCNGANPVKPEIFILLMLTWIVSVYNAGYNSCVVAVYNKFKRVLSPLRFADYQTTQLITKDRIKREIALELLAYFSSYDKRKDRKNHIEKIYMNFLS